MTGVTPLEIAAESAGGRGNGAPVAGESAGESGGGVLVTVAEYAELRSIARQNVYKALKRHGIAKVGGRFDMAALDRAREQQGDPARQMVQANQAAGVAESGGGSNGKAPGGSQFMEMRARREEADAKYAELKLEKARGDLVDRRQVHEAMVTAGRRIRERLDMLPSLSEELMAISATGEVPQIRAFLRKKVRDIEDAIVESLQIGDADA